MALLAGVYRSLSWGLPSVAREAHAWRSRGRAIADRALREDALQAITRKRAHLDGAALFAILPCARDTRLLRLLIAFEVMADFVDNVDEREVASGKGHRLAMSMAMIEAVDPDESISDHYRGLRCRDDLDYLESLIRSCRTGCATLPSFAQVRSPARRAASIAGVLNHNHEPDPGLRDAALMSWAEHQFTREADLLWYESAAAGSNWLAVLALLTLATEAHCEPSSVAATFGAYLPWASLAGTMLDSYVDAAEDCRDRQHSYVAHYPSETVAAERIAQAIERATRAVAELPRGNRHKVIVACMVAMYCSKDSALRSGSRATTLAFVRSGGSLVLFLLPILRLWRIAYSLRSA